MNQSRLFLGCFMALIATAFGFSVRTAILTDWRGQFDLSFEQAGYINGAGLFPFAISIILFSLIVDRIGYGPAMIFAFLGHLISALMTIFVRGRIMPERKNPVNRFLIWIYRPAIQGVLQHKGATILAALAALVVSLWPASKLGSEFMPNLNEGTLFYMPTTLPGISVTKAGELLQTQNKIIKSFPEVESVWGKAGRASTALAS